MGVEHTFVKIIVVIVQVLGDGRLTADEALAVFGATIAGLGFNSGTIEVVVERQLVALFQRLGREDAYSCSSANDNPNELFCQPSVLVDTQQCSIFGSRSWDRSYG